MIQERGGECVALTSGYYSIQNGGIEGRHRRTDRQRREQVAIEVREEYIGGRT